MAIPKRTRRPKYEPGEMRGKALSRRIAHFLDWAAKHMPMEFIAHNVITRDVNGYDHLPRLNSDEVELTRSTMTRVRQLLLKEHKRDLVSQPGVGVRATIDSGDVVMSSMPRRTRRVQAASASLAATTSIVDPAEFPKNDGFRPYKRWFESSVRDVVAQLTSPDFERKLLPPANSDKEKKDQQSSATGSDRR